MFKNSKKKREKKSNKMQSNMKHKGVFIARGNLHGLFLFYNSLKRIQTYLTFNMDHFFA